MNRVEMFLEDRNDHMETPDAKRFDSDDRGPSISWFHK